MRIAQGLPESVEGHGIIYHLPRPCGTDDYYIPDPCRDREPQPANRLNVLEELMSWGRRVERDLRADEKENRSEPEGGVTQDRSRYQFPPDDFDF